MFFFSFLHYNVMRIIEIYLLLTYQILFLHYSWGIFLPYQNIQPYFTQNTFL